jgi:hypothetical protein
MKTQNDVVDFIKKTYPNEKDIWKLVIDALEHYEVIYQEYKQFDVDLEHYFKNGRVK